MVTGAGRGVGQQIALQLAQAGVSRLALLARTYDQLVETARMVVLAGAEPLVLPVDLADRKSRAETIVKVLAQYGTVDILINNAGVTEPMGPTAEIEPVLWQRAVEVNLAAPVELTAAFLPTMLDQDWGRVVNVSSAATTGVRLLPGANAYVATKAGLEAHTLNLAFELDGLGVTVNVYRPRHGDTAMNQLACQLTPAASAAALLAHLDSGANGQIWHVDKTL